MSWPPILDHLTHSGLYNCNMYPTTFHIWPKTIHNCLKEFELLPEYRRPTSATNSFATSSGLSGSSRPSLNQPHINHRTLVTYVTFTDTHGSFSVLLDHSLYFSHRFPLSNSAVRLRLQELAQEFFGTMTPLWVGKRGYWVRWPPCISNNYFARQQINTNTKENWIVLYSVRKKLLRLTRRVRGWRVLRRRRWRDI